MHAGCRLGLNCRLCAVRIRIVLSSASFNSCVVLLHWPLSEMQIRGLAPSDQEESAFHRCDPLRLRLALKQDAAGLFLLR